MDGGRPGSARRRRRSARRSRAQPAGGRARRLPGRPCRRHALSAQGSRPRPRLRTPAHTSRAASARAGPDGGGHSRAEPGPGGRPVAMAGRLLARSGAPARQPLVGGAARPRARPGVAARPRGRPGAARRHGPMQASAQLPALAGRGEGLQAALVVAVREASRHRQARVRRPGVGGPSDPGSRDPGGRGCRRLATAARDRVLRQRSRHRGHDQRRLRDVRSRAPRVRQAVARARDGRGRGDQRARTDRADEDRSGSARPVERAHHLPFLRLQRLRAAHLRPLHDRLHGHLLTGVGARTGTAAGRVRALLPDGRGRLRLRDAAADDQHGLPLAHDVAHRLRRRPRPRLLLARRLRDERGPSGRGRTRGPQGGRDRRLRAAGAADSGPGAPCRQEGGGRPARGRQVAQGVSQAGIELERTYQDAMRRTGRRDALLLEYRERLARAPGTPRPTTCSAG